MISPASPTAADPLGWFDSATAPSGWDVAFAVLTIVAAWVISIFAKRGVLALLHRVPGIADPVALLIARVVKYGIVVLGIGIGLTFLGASVQPLIAVALIVGVILVLALRGVAENFAASVVIQSRHPFRIGDEIETGDHQGIVTDINGRTVIIRATDGTTVHVPNSLVISSPIINFAEAKGRRAEVEVRVSGDVDEATVRAVIAEGAASAAHVHREPGPSVYLQRSAPGSLSYLVRFWHAPGEVASASDSVATALTSALADHDIAAGVSWPPAPPPLTPPSVL